MDAEAQFSVQIQDGEPKFSALKAWGLHAVRPCCDQVPILVWGTGVVLALLTPHQVLLSFQVAKKDTSKFAILQSQIRLDF